MSVPLLDVSEITADVDFSDTFDVIRRSEYVNANGILVLTPTTFAGQIGVVYIRGRNDLIRADSHDMTMKEIFVVTQFRLQGSSPGVKADNVVWRGNTFIVSRIEDFSNYGTGFIRARCTAVALQDQPPQS